MRVENSKEFLLSNEFSEANLNGYKKYSFNSAAGMYLMYESLSYADLENASDEKTDHYIYCISAELRNCSETQKKHWELTFKAAK